MILFKKFQERLLLFIKDIIVCYTHNSDTYTEHQIPQLSTSTEERSFSSVCVSKHHDYLAVALSNKQLIVFDTKFSVLSITVSKRAVSRIKFTPDNDLLIADKTGDVFVYKRNGVEEPKLVLGHLSMLLDVDVSDCGKYVITSDRDEKIRVSRYPNAYNIVSFCLGHWEFVTNVVVCGTVLVSASGDGTVRLWNYLSGEELTRANTNERVTDKNVISDFCKGMCAESVDVEALPITDMQVHVKDNLIYIGVTVLGINDVQMYISDGASSITYLETVKVSFPLIAFYLSDQLIILTNSEITVYSVRDNKYIESNLNFEGLFRHCKHLLSDANLSSSISALYKRKYDNVQDYLEKKKLRLENKS